VPPPLQSALAPAAKAVTGDVITQNEKPATTSAMAHTRLRIILFMSVPPEKGLVEYRRIVLTVVEGRRPATGGVGCADTVTRS